MVETSIGNISYEDPELVNNSLIPVLRELKEDTTKILDDGIAKLVLTSSVWNEPLRRSEDYHVKTSFNPAVLDFQNQTADSLRAKLQAFADDAAIARRDRDSTLQRCLALEDKLSVAETANRRFAEALDNLKPLIERKIEDAAGREQTRIHLVRELTEKTASLTAKNNELNKKLNTTTNLLNQECGIAEDLQSRLHEMEQHLRESETKNERLRQSVERLEGDLKTTTKRADDLNTALIRAEKRIRESNQQMKEQEEKLKSNNEYFSKEKDKLVAEHTKALEHMKIKHKKEANEEVAKWNDLLSSHKKWAEEALSEAKDTIEYLTKERLHYYNEYKTLINEINEHKINVTKECQLRLAGSLKEMMMRFGREESNAKNDRRTLLNLEQPNYCNRAAEYLKALESDTTESENMPPRKVTRRNSLSTVARNYNVASRFSKK